MIPQDHAAAADGWIQHQCKVRCNAGPASLKATHHVWQASKQLKQTPCISYQQCCPGHPCQDALWKSLQWPLTLRVDGPNGQQSGNNHRYSPRGKLHPARHEERLIQRPVSAAAQSLVRALKALSRLQTLVSANLSQSCLHRLNTNAQLPRVSCQRASRRPHRSPLFVSVLSLLLCYIDVSIFSGASSVCL